ncbi:ATP-grasp domain-containing protein [Streptomyces sp. Ag109_G2-6]|nr:ATP-grasp domain-containing protein [Streptomyces sp. Ag109_G2-6]
MSDSRDVLVFSKRLAGGVRQIAGILKAAGKRPILVSAMHDDLNREACDGHVVVDWDTADLQQLVEAVDRAGVVPTAVVNLVEPLISWQVQVARHYGFPGGDSAWETLLSKVLVRSEMKRIGQSLLWFDSGLAGSYQVETVTNYPVIVKPARDSGASRLVRRADDATHFRNHLRDMSQAAGPELEVIIEEYLDGIEFSIDGPVVDGIFRGLFFVEKAQHDERRHHDAGLRISPPQSSSVRSAAEQMVEKISALCTDLGLSRGWLHVEGRALADGGSELIEINPRVGGGLYEDAIIRTCGIDPVRITVLMALGEEDVEWLKACERNEELLALLPFEADQIGTVVHATPIEELKRIPGVVDGYQFAEYKVTSLENENFFTEVLIAGDGVERLSEIAEEVRSAFSFRIE